MLRSTLGAVLALALLIPAPAEGQTHPAGIALEHADSLQLTDAQRERLQVAFDAWLESAEERSERMEALRERMMETDRQRIRGMRALPMERREGLMEVRDVLTGEQFREFRALARDEMPMMRMRMDRMRTSRPMMHRMRMNRSMMQRMRMHRTPR